MKSLFVGNRFARELFSFKKLDKNRKGHNSTV